MIPRETFFLRCAVALMIALNLSEAQQVPVDNSKVGSRQVHLDFHTSELIEDIGANFSKEQFQEALRVGRVNWINIFGKCHHGLTYYPTLVGEPHPHLDFDLLGAQIEACHEIGVKCPIYFTVGLSEVEALKHPEWRRVNKDGSYGLKGSNHPDPVTANPATPKPLGQWYQMCVNTGYHQRIKAQVIELCEAYDVDGFWFDIYNANLPCYCQTCRAEMMAEGVNIEDDTSVLTFRSKVLREHMNDLVQTIAAHEPNALTFFNGTTAIYTPQNFKYKLYEFNSYQDLEDLPTTSWCDYDRLPVLSKHYLATGYTVTGMSGKFHTGWGEFGGFKHKNAILYEAAAMIAFGANCNFGDQLHPLGKMNMSTYKNIGYAYEYIEKIEDYGIGGLPEARLGLWRSLSNNHDEALAKMLLQSHFDFEIANHVEDLSKFKVIVIPDIPFLSQEDADRINTYVQHGGGLLVMGDGALDETRSRFLLDIGATYLGPSERDIDYLVLGDPIRGDLIEDPFLNYMPALRIQPETGTEVLATIREPYFNRTLSAFSGHKNTPYLPEPADYPGVIQKGKVIYFAHNLGTMYNRYGMVLHREAFANALRRIHPNPIVEVDMPSEGRISLLHQKEKNRYVLHLLYAPKTLRGDYEIIEDLPALTNTLVKLDLPKSINNAYLIPSGERIPVEQTPGEMEFVIDSFSCHTAIVLEY